MWLRGFCGRPTPCAGSYKTGAGCNHCNKTGYASARVGVYELLEVDADLADARAYRRCQVFAAAGSDKSTSYRPLCACRASTGRDAASRA